MAHIRVPLMVLDTTLRVVWVNEAYSRLFTTQDSTEIGQSVFAIGNGQWDIPAFRELLEQRLPTERVVDQLELSGTFGPLRARVLLVSASSSAGDNGDGALITLTFEDVTERVNAEAALRESEEFNRSIVESSRDCIKILSLDGRLLRMTSGGQKLICIEDIGEFVGKSWENLWAERDHQSARTAIAAAVAGGVGSFVGTLITLKGEPKWWDVLITPLHDENGVANRLLAVSRDVTDRRHAELNASLLASVSDQLSVLGSVDEILHLAGERLAEYLGIAGLLFAQIDERTNHVKITHEWPYASGASLLGSYSPEHWLEPDLLNTSRSGALVTVGSTQGSVHTSRVLEATGSIGAFVSVPFLRNERWSYSIVAHRGDSYTWAAHELEVIRELSARVVHNVERAWAEDALRRNESLYRAIGDSIDYGIWICDAEGRNTYASASFLNLLGITQEECSNFGWGDRLHADERDRSIAAWKECVRTGGTWDVEHHFLSVTGESRTVLSRGVPARDANGAVAFWAGINLDITNLKRTEASLARAMAESEQNRRLYHTVLSNTPDFIYVFDLNHRFTYINEALLRVYGLTWDEANGRDWIGLGYEQWHADMHDREIDEVIATKSPIRGEIPFSGTNGRRIYDYIFSPVLDADGEVVAVAGTTRDVTERKRAEAAREAERKVFERVATGASLQETLATLLEETEAQSTSGIRCAIRLLDANGQYLADEVTKQRPDRSVQVSSVALPITALDGEVLGTFTMTYRDEQEPGDRESSEHAVSEHDRQLAARAAQLAAIIIERKQAETALDDNAARLREADRSKDQFLAMLAHELRNPLAPIRNATAILQDAAASAADRDRAQRLIARQTENMSRIIDDLLDVSRISEGKIELRLQAVQLGVVVSAAIEDARVACAANAQRLSASLPDKPIFLKADPTRLEQLFGNLLSNACKHSGVGSHIQVTAETPDEDTVLVCVSDNGVGIEPELLPRIFELFVQSSSTLDRAHGGLGIGLTIVDRLVKLHGGTITAHSAGLGQGTTFSIRLPRMNTLPIAPAPQKEVPQEEKSRRVLIVDDNEDAAESMAILLQLRGHDTRTAHTGPDAVAVAREFAPDVVLLDIGLPDIDGYEVARRIRKLPSSCSAFLVALTGYGTAGDREKARLAGFDDHMAKPADLNVLRDWIRTRVRA